ncbi:MAG TPA: protein kinase [Gemmataceae bacterium]|nr:protein kinase [Gemmataceae bacterium]
MISRRQSSVASATGDFLCALRASGLLPPETLAALAPGSASRDPRAWASELIERGLLTGYQAEQLLAGNGQSLVLGQYRILDTLGAGGMGRVYKAEHVLMRRVVALKVVGVAEHGPDATANAERHAAFLREIESAARLTHPNVVAAYDAGEANGVRFLVMEYVDGLDLDRLVREVGPLPSRRACEYARQAAVALQYAYERGVLHRDVKPANLLVEPGEGARSPGRVKVLDLGLALSTRGGDGGADAASRLSGTPDYIAPEVAHDADSRDVRSDLYSLGCTLYYLLTGRVPFPGGTWTEKLLRHQYDAPAPLRDLAPTVPPAVAAAVERLMAKLPADRYDTPAAVARALEEWLALAEDPPASPAPAGGGEALPAAQTLGSAMPSDPDEGSACPTTIDTPGPPSAWDIPVPPPVPAPQPAPPPRSGRRLPWLIVFGAAILAGLGGAWLVRGSLIPRQATTATAPPAPGFVVEGRGTTHATLATAVAEAADGDVITIHGDGPFATEPLSLTGKALTLRAAPGSRPSLHFDGRPAAWQALLSSDRPLALEGIELRQTPGREPAHLVYAAGAALRLTGCRVTGDHHAAPIVARGANRIELRDCRLLVGQLALCAEVAPHGPCAISLCGNTIEVRNAGAAAVSVWAGERRGNPVSIEMEANDVHAPRILSLGELNGGVALTIRDNHFAFDEALLCLNGFGGQECWRQAVTWRGQGNRYKGAGDWLCIDGRPAGAPGLRAWQELWGTEAE